MEKACKRRFGGEGWGGGKSGGVGEGKGFGLDGLRPSRAAAWISYLDACEGSILFEFVNRDLSAWKLYIEKLSE